MLDDDSRTRVFISYSRKDMTVALELRDQLIEAGFDAFLDVHDIVKGEPWQDRLSGLIERSDTMLFLISPASVASDICNWEVNGAELQEKRILPVVVRETPTDEIPQRLQRLNFTFLDSKEKWASELPLLVSALNEDIIWTREHTRLGELALRWDRAGRPGRLLLRGADLGAAERWRDQRPANGAQVSALHTALLSSSRAGAQRRTRIWFTAVSFLAVFAIALSSFAYWQRDLALRNGEIAERRAATLATDVALARAQHGAFNEGLLMLLDASTRYPADAVPEKLLLGLRDVTAKARQNRRFWFSARSKAFHVADNVIVSDSAAGTLFLIDPAAGTRREIARIDDQDVSAVAITDNVLWYVTRDQRLYQVSLSGGATNAPQLVATLVRDGEQIPDWSVPAIRPAGPTGVIGQRKVGLAGGKGYLDELWRYDLEDGELKRTVVKGNIGDWLAERDGEAFFWNRRKHVLRALALDSGKVVTLSRAEAIARDVVPCPVRYGRTSAEHLAAIYAQLKPGLEQVRCAGLYGPLALMSQTRALARSTMDEYFLFPANAPVEVARKTFWLEAAIDRLGSLGAIDPFTWHTGAPEHALVAVGHADKILVLGLRTGQFLQSTLYPDEDNVAREITAPDVTDGARFHKDAVLTYSGPDGDRYQVTVARMERRRRSDYPVAKTKPERAYWGSCSVQRPTQGNRPYVVERSFAVKREAPGHYTVAADGRTLTIAVDELQCASFNTDGTRLAVVDTKGVTLFDTSAPDTQAPVEIARLEDASIDRVSFAGPGQAILITSHDYKVMAWRPDGQGGYRAETALRSSDFVMFAEGAPDGERMLVWYEIGGASALTAVLPIKPSGMTWLNDGPYMLVGNPDVFFDVNGGVFREEQRTLGQLMEPVKLERLRVAASASLSPSCQPREPGNYRSSTCWPGSF